MKIRIAFLVVVLTSIATFSQKKWTLKECVNHALKNNITVKQNRLNVTVSEANIKSAKGNFLPSLNASTNGNLNFGSTFDPVSNNRVSTTTFGGSLGLGTNVTIFNGFRNLNTYKQAKLGVETAKLNVSVIENDISLQVVNAYLNVLFAKENLSVAKTQSEISIKQIERAKAQFEAGAIPKGDLLNVESTAANNYQSVITSENNLNLSLFRLAQLLQVSSKGFDVQEIKMNTPSLTLLYNNADKVYDKAVINRPEIERGKLNVENSDLSIELAKSSYYPTISASGNIGTNYGYNLDLPPGASNTSLGTQLDNNLGYGVGFSVNIPIFNGFRNDAGVERAKINKLISQSRLENQKLQLRQTIEQAYLDAKLAAQTYKASETSLNAQKEAFKNAQTSYDYGAMTLFDFDQVRNRLVNAESALIRAKYDYVFKTKVLQFYFGENILE